MAKVVALINSDPELKRLCELIQERKIFFHKRIKAVEEELKKLDQEIHEQDKPVWEQIIKHLKATGAIEKYDKSEEHLSFSMEENTITLCGNDENQHPLHKILGLIT